MIGLGSNRSTVCRRGGMSVTQAGRGGMEWLAGGRMPSWASPYSAQATAALKAQFQTQWPTIRDYGFAHPEIVGYMNAYAPEDAKIAYSLIPDLGIRRYITCAGSQYADTGLYMQPEGRWTIKYRLGTYSNYPMLFGTQWDDGASGFAVDQNGGSSSMIQIAGYTKTKTLSGFVTLVLGWAGGTWAGESFSTGRSKTTSGKTIWLGGVRGGYSKWRGDIESLEYDEGGDTLHKYVPYKVNDVAYWLDLNTGERKPNAGSGSFTISESPS